MWSAVMRRYLPDVTLTVLFGFAPWGCGSRANRTPRGGDGLSSQGRPATSTQPTNATHPPRGVNAVELPDLRVSEVPVGVTPLNAIPRQVGAWHYDESHLFFATVACTTAGVIEADSNRIRLRELEHGGVLWESEANSDWTRGGTRASGEYVIVQSLDTRGQLVALNARDGSRAWTLDCDSSHRGFPCDNTGVRSGDVWVAIVSGHGAVGVDRRTGVVRWRQAIDLRPTVLGGDDARAYLASGHVLVALRTNDGVAAWRTSIDSEIGVSGSAIEAAGGRVCINTMTEVTCFDAPSGRKLWTRTPQNVFTVLNVRSDGIALGGSTGVRGYVVMLDPSTGAQRWTRNVAEPVTALLAAGGDSLWAGTVNGLMELSLAGGSVTDATSTHFSQGPDALGTASNGRASTTACGGMLVSSTIPIGEILAVDLRHRTRASWVEIRGRAEVRGLENDRFNAAAAREHPRLWMGAMDGFARTEADGSFVLRFHGQGGGAVDLVSPNFDCVRGTIPLVAEQSDPVVATFNYVPCHEGMNYHHP